MIAHQVAGKATRDAVFLSHYDVTELPKVVIVAAVLSMLAVVVMSRLLVRFGPSRVIPAAFAFSTLLFFVNWWFYGSTPQKVAISLYLQMAVFGAVLISGFWSVVNERFDPHTAKQTIARVAAAATLGGVLGGLLAGKVAEAIDVRAMLIVLGLLHLACVGAVLGIGEPRRHQAHLDQTAVGSGIHLLFTTRYLQLMGLLMVLVAVLAALVDYAFKSAASARLDSSEQLIAFFGQFYATVGVLTFVVQSALGPRMLRRFGIGVTLAVMPAVALGLTAVGALFVRLWTVVLLRGAQMVFTNSFFRSSFELLYTPLPPSTKRPTKAIIDVASDRLGDVLGGGLILILLAVLPALSAAAVLFTALVVAIVALVIVGRLYRGYIEQLASSLRDGAVSLSDDEVVDATTRHTLAEVSALSERELLLARIREMKYSRVGADPASAKAGIESAPAPRGDGDRSELSAALGWTITELLSGDAPRVRRILTGDFMDASLVPFLVPLLADDTVAEDVRMELRWMAPRTVGALTDALLDPDLELVARQRIPSVIEITHNARAIEALSSGLTDEEFNVRYSCARALARMIERDPALSVDPSFVYAVVQHEVSMDEPTWNSRDLQVDVDLPIDLAAGGSQRDPRVNYSMEHVFTLLSLVLDRDALFLSLQAVFSSDRNLRGTALEYLENVLPENIRRGLWPHLGQRVPARRSNRSPSDLATLLKRAGGKG
jgi:hypothetical protein